jgi:hypothetical protein
VLIVMALSEWQLFQFRSSILRSRLRLGKETFHKIGALLLITLRARLQKKLHKPGRRFAFRAQQSFPILSLDAIECVPIVCPSVLVSAGQEIVGGVWSPLSCKSQSPLSETPHKSVPRCDLPSQQRIPKLS